jgi:hypothetical protein
VAGAIGGCAKIDFVFYWEKDMAQEIKDSGFEPQKC